MQERKGVPGYNGIPWQVNLVRRDRMRAESTRWETPDVNYNGVCILLVSTPAGDTDNSHDSTSPGENVQCPWVRICHGILP